MLKLAASLLVGGLVATMLPTFALEEPELEIPPRPQISRFKTLEAQKTVDHAPEEKTAVLEPPVPSPLPTEPIVSNVGDNNAVGDVEGIENKHDWLRAAGIPEADWWAVDFIVSKESTWRHLVWNSTGSPAYGLCQSLPAEKMASAGADYMTNPVTQLRWCDSYANERYGSWAAAVTFWQANSWW